MNITPEITEILKRGSFEGNVFKLPPGQLDRKTYESVNRVLLEGGGKWNRSFGGHVFKKDPREILGVALDSGSIVSTKKITQAFFTPPQVVEEMLSLAWIQSGNTVLEPSAGIGNIAIPAANLGADVTCVEIDSDSLDQLRTNQGLRVIAGDFLEMKFQQFDAVLMNPPFTKDQDIKHVLHAWKFVKPGGLLIAITSLGWTFGETKIKRSFAEFVDTHCEARINLDPGTFKESGTNVATILIKLQKP